jgi:hypothetical protein
VANSQTHRFIKVLGTQYIKRTNSIVGTPVKQTSAFAFLESPPETRTSVGASVAAIWAEAVSFVEQLLALEASMSAVKA